MTSLKSNFIKLLIVLSMVVVLLVTLSLSLASSFREATAQSSAHSQNIAIGFSGDPMPLSIRSGDAMNRNS